MYGRNLLAAVALAGALLAPTAHAALNADARVSVYFITFDDLTFANANARYDVHVDMSGTDGDTLVGYNPTVKTSQQNFSWNAGTNGTTSESFLTVSNIVPPATNGFALGDLKLDGGNSGAYDFGYDSPATGFASSWLARGTGPSEYSLAFSGGGGGLVNSGGLFTIVVFVEGNWTQHGTSPGELELLGLNPVFATNYSFDYYDSGLDATLFSASATSDGTSGFGPNLSFILHGDPIRATVPEPASLLLLATCLAGLGFARRGRR